MSESVGENDVWCSDDDMEASDTDACLGALLRPGIEGKLSKNRRPLQMKEAHVVGSGENAGWGRPVQTQNKSSGRMTSVNEESVIKFRNLLMRCRVSALALQ